MTLARGFIFLRNCSGIFCHVSALPQGIIILAFHWVSWSTTLVQWSTVVQQLLVECHEIFERNTGSPEGFMTSRILSSTAKETNLFCWNVFCLPACQMWIVRKCMLSNNSHLIYFLQIRCEKESSSNRERES